MTQIAIDSGYLKADICIKNTIREVVIATEASTVEKEFQGKKDTRVECEVTCLPSNEKRIWSMNKSSARTLINIFGSDSKSWIGKKIRLQFVDTSTGKSVQVDEIETRALNK